LGRAKPILGGRIFDFIIYSNQLFLGTTIVRWEQNLVAALLPILSVASGLGINPILPSN